MGIADPRFIRVSTVDRQSPTDLLWLPLLPPPFDYFTEPKLGANQPPILTDFPANPEYLRAGLQTGGSVKNGVNDKLWLPRKGLIPKHGPFRHP